MILAVTGVPVVPVGVEVLVDSFVVGLPAVERVGVGVLQRSSDGCK